MAITTLFHIINIIQIRVACELQVTHRCEYCSNIVLYVTLTKC